MKNSRKYLALIISAAIAASLSLPAYALEENTGSTAEAAYTSEENTSNSAEAEYAETINGLLNNVANTDEYGGERPDLSIAAGKKVTKLPETGTYEPGQFLVKVGGSGYLKAAGPMLGDNVESAEPLFSVPVAAKASFRSGAASVEATWYLVKLSDKSDMLDEWNNLLSESGVLAVEPDYKVFAESTADIGSNDPFEHAQTWLDDIKAPEAWSKLSSKSDPGTGITVAVVDSGVDITHPDLTGSLWSDSNGYHGYDFVNGDNNPEDQAGHGTHVAGIIAASKNNVGTVGVAYGAKIMAVKVLNEKGSGSTSQIISGIEYAVTNGANIINLSLGGLGGSQAYSDEIKALSSTHPGVLVVAAAGNEGLPTTYAGDDYYGAYAAPANIPGVLTVMAMDSKPAANGDWLAKFSNYDADPIKGYEYELMAPGVNILSTRMGGGYTYMSGTSMACPTVAGAAAVMMGLGCSKDQTWSYLANSGEVRQGKTQPNNSLGRFHILDLKAAIESMEAGTAYNPFIANLAVTAACKSVTVDGTTVSLDSLNTKTNVYFQDGSLISSINLTIENLGAASGAVTVTGTVGGATASGSVSSMGSGEIVTIPLTISGTPSKAASVQVSLTIVPHDSKGYVISGVNVGGSFKAYDFTMPSGISYSDGKYRLSSTTVTVGGNSGAISPILCLTHDLYIESGRTLTFQSGAIYESGGAKIEVASGGNALFIQDTLLGNGNFSCKYNEPFTANTNLQFNGCSIQDPYIESANIINQTQLYGSSKSSVTSKKVTSLGIKTSGFYYLSGLTVSCNIFAYNLMNQCVGSTLSAAQIAAFNSFVDNGNYLSDKPLQPLTVIVPDYQSSPLSGFCNSCVVGPITVKKSDSSLAVINNVYYQTVNSSDVDLGDGKLRSVLPSGTSDTITCAAGSSFSSDMQAMLKAGYSRVCPSFVIYMYLDSYSTNGLKVPYTLGCYFSTPPKSGYLLRCYSPTDPFCTGQNISAKTAFQDNGCTFSLCTALTDREMTEYCELADYYTQDYTFSDNSTNYYWATSMGEQSLYRFPAKFSFYSTNLDVDIKSNQSENPVLTWPTDDYKNEAGCAVKVFRSVNGGAESELATVTSATYTDSGLSAGNIYTYYVRVYRSDGTQILSGSVDYAINSAQTAVRITPTSTSQSASTLSIGCDKPISFTSLELGLTYDEGTFDLDSISFSDEVKNSGLPYGIIKTADGEATLYIGQNLGSSTVLPACTLATISAANNDTSNTDALHISMNSMKIDGNTCGWNTVGCSFIIRAASNKLAYTDDGSAVSMWRQSNDDSSVFISEYDSAGKMLQILSPTTGANNFKFAASNSNGKRLSVFYLDSSNKAPLRKNVEIVLK